ncbi:hypothetical protein D3C76_1629650 [compost metagenome]
MLKQLVAVQQQLDFSPDLTDPLDEPLGVPRFEVRRRNDILLGDLYDLGHAVDDQTDRNLA